MRMRRRQLRRRQRPAVELAVRRQRQPLQHHQRGRHHVVRQLPRQRCPQAPRYPQPRPPPPPHSRSAAGSPGPSCRAITAACDTPACAASAASISPGSIRNPRSFTCASARPRNSSTPSDRHRARSPVRYIRLPAAPMPVGDKPLRRQRRPVQIAPRQPNTRDVQLTDNTRRHRLKTAVQHIGPRVPDRTPDRRAFAVPAHPVRAPSTADQIVVSVGPYRLVELRGHGPPAAPAPARPAAPRRRSAWPDALRSGQMLAALGQQRLPQRRRRLHDGGAGRTDQSAPAPARSCTVSRGAMTIEAPPMQRQVTARAPQCRSRWWSRRAAGHAGRKPHLLGHRAEEVAQAPWRHHDALRRAGRARGVDHIGRMARIEIERRRSCGLPRDRRCSRRRAARPAVRRPCARAAGRAAPLASPAPGSRRRPA